MSDYRHDPEYLKQRREVIRKYHPDRGGSDDQLIRALKDLETHWDRRQRLRIHMEEFRPNFISIDVADQAVQRAERAVSRVYRVRDQVVKLADSTEKQIRKQAGSARTVAGDTVRKIRREVASDGFMETMARNAGKSAGEVQKRLRRQQ